MNRVLVALTLTSSLLTSQPGRSLLLSELPAWLTSLWSEPAAKEGCGFDPDGLRAPVPPPPSNTDAGCGFDPWGCPTGS